jgi:Raf kinase inhibitor-like YbhB/YbcL family protein
MQGFMWRGMGMAAVGCLLLFVGVGCSAEGKLAANSELSGGLWTVGVSSTAFKHGEAIPEKYTAEGMNISPPLKWSRGPSGLREWILVVQDADAKAKEGYPATHWAVFKIPANVTEFPEGASKSIKYPQGRNYLGEANYAGPNPPGGKVHRYYFQLFAVDADQDIPAGATREQVIKNFKGHVLSKGWLMGTYSKQK